MGNLVPLLGNKKLFATADGSISFYNLSYEEAYHAKSIGAYTESLYKYVMASNIVNILREKPIKLLDIGFGLGYNLAVTIEKTKDLKNKLSITSLEKDPEIIEIVKNTIFLWPVYGYKVLRILLENGSFENYDFKLKIGDARNYILNCKDTFDVIFFDPFSKRNNGEMWDVDIISKMYHILNDGGVIATYACSKRIRKDFSKAGFNFKEIPNLPDGFQSGTIFYK
jgi:chorismate dehydratase